MNATLSRINRIPRVVTISLAFGLVMVVGLIDYTTGYELSFSVFYLVPIVALFWISGRAMAILASILSIGIWMLGDWMAGMHSSLILGWNGVITMAFYMIVLALLAWLKSFHETLESRIKERTAAFSGEMAERERLEKEILRIGESERQRIGYDLHDNLGQHLTGTAIAAMNVEQDLADMGHETAASMVHRIVDLVEGGISLARKIARGLAPVHLEADGLIDFLEELAVTTRSHLNTECHFEHEGTVWTVDVAAEIHLYRIAQEAVSNAVRHGKAKHITIRYSKTNGHVALTIKDDGCGLTVSTQENKGMGLLIMKHRAAMIGASLSVGSVPEEGTVVTCTFDKPYEPNRDEQEVR